MKEIVYTAPDGTGKPVLGKTLPQLMYEAAERYENLRALNQPQGDGWKPFSLEDFRRHSEELAVGLTRLGLERGDRVALYMESDVYYCIVDMGCLIAGLVDVPIYLTHEPEQIQYVIDHSGAAAIAISDLEQLAAVREMLVDSSTVRWVIVAEGVEHEDVPALPDGIEMHTIGSIRDLGRRYLHDDPEAVAALTERVDPHDLATLIYTSGTTGRPKGVMLSHENITYDALTSFSGIPDYRPGADGETAISFLPLTHIFARALHYGFLYNGTSVYFTTPDDLTTVLKQVRPTVFLTVPRVLEKVYGNVLERITEMSGPKKALVNWALSVGERYTLSEEPSGLFRLQLAVADRILFRKWRDALGGRVRYIISGGAALSGKLANLFGAAGLSVLQGYGLTETSPVITFNRPGRNRAGTVGEPIPGLEVKIAEDGEILTRGPHVMLGYYRDEGRTREALDEDGWFHTGDIGEFTDDGFLRITDRKKDLFKLSTGKYVIPQPLENRLTTHPLIEQAVVVGSDYKYCTALVFPDEQKVRVLAGSQGTNRERPIEELVSTPAVKARFRQLVEEANEGMDHWSRIKRFRIIPAHLTTANGLLTPTMKVRRRRVHEAFKEQIEEMYATEEPEGSVIVVERVDHREAA
ncbi:MAG: long-chain fatty acid--CoA ligase [Rhodothermales bacterium]